MYRRSISHCAQERGVGQAGHHRADPAGVGAAIPPSAQTRAGLLGRLSIRESHGPSLENGNRRTSSETRRRHRQRSTEAERPSTEERGRPRQRSTSMKTRVRHALSRSGWVAGCAYISRPHLSSYLRSCLFLLGDSLTGMIRYSQG